MSGFRGRGEGPHVGQQQRSAARRFLSRSVCHRHARCAYTKAPPVRTPAVLLHRIVDRLLDSFAEAYQHATSAEVDAHFCLEYALFGNLLVSTSLHEPHKGRFARGTCSSSVCHSRSFLIVYSHDKKPNCTKAANDYEHLIRFYGFVYPARKPGMFSAQGAFSAQRTHSFGRVEARILPHVLDWRIISPRTLRVLCIDATRARLARQDGETCAPTPWGYRRFRVFCE